MFDGKYIGRLLGHRFSTVRTIRARSLLLEPPDETGFTEDMAAFESEERMSSL
jgi:hypothetical protein